MSGKRRFQKVVKIFSGVKEDVVTLYPGLLGLKIGGQKTIEVSGRSGYVYIRLLNNLNEVIQAYNDQVPVNDSMYDLPVLVRRDKTDKGKWYVYGKDTGRYSNWGGFSYLPTHGDTHSFDESDVGIDITYVHNKQFMPHLVYPTSSTGSATVDLYPYPYYGPDGNWHYAGQQTITGLLDYVPSTTGTAQILLIYFDGNDTPLIATGSSVSSDVTNVQTLLNALPSLPTSTSDPIALVKVNNNTTTFGWDNVIPLRQLHSWTSFTGTVTGVGHTIQDDGVSQTARTYLNFVGDGFVLWDTGTQTNVSGTASGGASVVWDGSQWNPLAKPTSANAKDDEFDNDSLDGKWTEWDVNTVLSVAENNWGAELSTLAGTYCGVGITQPIPSATNFTFWTRAHLFSDSVNDIRRQCGIIVGEDLVDNPSTSNFYFYGLQLWPDTSSAKVVAAQYSDYSLVSGTSYGTGVDVPVSLNSIYLRCRYTTGTDEFQFELSYDGIAWMTTIDNTFAFTPKQIGIGLIGEVDNVNKAVFEFFRVVNTNTNIVLPGNRVEYKFDT